MKKTIFFLLAGSIVVGALILAGVAYAFGAVAEAGVRRAAETEPDEDVLVKWQMELGDYQRGFFSSETSSRLHLDSETGEGVELRGENGTPLRHVIYHGPLAMTPDGPKLCSYHIVTTVRLEKLNQTARENIEKVFGTSEPITIHTTTGFGGDQVTRFEVASFESEDEDDGAIHFAGAIASFETGPEMAYARGEFEIGAIEGSDLGMYGMELSISPSTGKFNYVRGNRLNARLNLGPMKGDSAATSFTMAPSDGEIDWQRNDHLKGNLTLGAIAANSTGTNGKILAGPGTASIDFNRVSDAFDVLLGEIKLHLEKVEIGTRDQLVSIEDFVLRIDSGEKSGKLFGLIGYEIGGIVASESPPSPIPVNELLGKGLKVELGVRGFDLATIESLVGKGAEIPGLEGIKSLSDFSDPEISNRFGEALAANSEAFSEYARSFMGLIQPGLETYYTAELRGARENSGFDIRLGMGGDTKLTEMKTAREILASITGNAIVRVSKSQFPPEQFEALVAGGPAEPFVAEHPNHFEIKGELQDGNLYVNGEAMPLLEELGPALDEKIDWDGIFAGMAEEMAAEK